MTDAQERIGQSIGDYRLLRILGKGTFGTVYLAEHLHEHSFVAMKVLHILHTGSNDPSALHKEARRVRLRHTHIVSVLDFDVSSDAHPYLVMTYVDGGSLRDRYPQGSKLPSETIDTYVQQLASALQYAHDCHVIHGDVKPENILLSGDGTVQLSDFGIARLSEQASLPSQHKAVKTPAYAAPEQRQGKPCPASDQYALAMIVHEWFTGQIFQGEPPAAQEGMDEAPSLSPEVPSQMKQVILKALTKAPEDRFPTITHFAQALHTALQDTAPIEVLSNRLIFQSIHVPPKLLQSFGQVSMGFHQIAFWLRFVRTGLQNTVPMRSLSNWRRSQSTWMPHKFLQNSGGVSPRLSLLRSMHTALQNTRPMQTLSNHYRSQGAQMLRQLLQSFGQASMRLRQLSSRLGSAHTTQQNTRPMQTLSNRHRSQSTRYPTIPTQRNWTTLIIWITLIGSLFITLVTSGNFAALWHLLPTSSVTSTQNGSTTTAISEVVGTVSPQHQIATPPTPTPTPTSVPTPIPTPAPISPAISAGPLLYSTPHPFSGCDKQGGHWTNTADANVTCNADGSKIVNTSGHLTIANLEQLGGNQASWPGQNFIVQVQVSISQNSSGAFGIDFQPQASDNSPVYFAYLLSPSDDWSFSYYNTQKNITNTLIASQLLSSAPTKLTIDIRVEGTYYSFYVNGTDTTGRAVTGTQYIDKIIGLAADANADVTFSNLAIYALP
jgi:serine/threonine protein kinase